MSKQPLTNADGEVRTLSAEDFKQMRPAAEVLPKELVAVLPKRGRPIADNPKISTTIRLSPEVVDFFKSQGKGWQTSINDVLQQYVDSKHCSTGR